MPFGTGELRTKNFLPIPGWAATSRGRQRTILCRAAGIQTALRQDLFESSLKNIELKLAADDLGPAPPEFPAKGAIAEKAAQRFREPCGVAPRHKQTIDAIFDQVGRAAAANAHHRPAKRHRF